MVYFNKIQMLNAYLLNMIETCFDKFQMIGLLNRAYRAELVLAMLLARSSCCHGGPSSKALAVHGHRLDALVHGKRAQISWNQQAHCSLDFATRDGQLAVHVGEVRSFVGDSFENVVHERVQDAHGLARYAQICGHTL